jgi:hypothetical protein
MRVDGGRRHVAFEASPDQYSFVATRRIHVDYQPREGTNEMPRREVAGYNLSGGI